MLQVALAYGAWFSICAFAACVAQFAIADAIEIVWIDFLNVNPHRTRSHALGMMMSAPLVGYFQAMIWSTLPVAVGGVVYGVLRTVLKSMGWWSAAISGCACTLTGVILLEADYPSDEETVWSLSTRAFLRSYVYYGPATLAVHYATILRE